MNKLIISSITRCLLFMSIFFLVSTTSIQGCSRGRRHHGRRHHHGHHHNHGRYHGRGYYGGYYGWGPYYGYGWGYGYPYYDYPVVAPAIGLTFASRCREKPKKIIGLYSVSNKTQRTLAIATTIESKQVQPGDIITLHYSKKSLTITSDSPAEEIRIRPLSRSIVITEQENGQLYIED